MVKMPHQGMKPFALSLSKGIFFPRMCFDKLSTNGGFMLAR